MGVAMWPETLYDDTIRPSTLVKGGWYCPPCEAHYTPGLEWGYRYPASRSDTTGRADFYSVKKLGNECPRCGRLPAVIDGRDDA
jgi:hypothetical protein